MPRSRFCRSIASDRISTRRSGSSRNGPVNASVKTPDGMNPLLVVTVFSTIPFGGRMPTSFRAFLSLERRQAAEISLDEWLHSRHIEAADKHEREVARVRETVLVERQRLFDINLADHLGGEPASAHVILGKRVLHHTLVDL